MKALLRRAAMARIIEEQGGADVTDLAKRFGVSAMTVRRDRRHLTEQHRVAPTHGGAVPSNFLLGDIPYDSKATARLKEKQAIARAALSLVRDDSCIILDSGTTTLELARLLLGRRLTVVTTDLRIALLLSQGPQLQVFSTGGMVDPVSRGHSDMSTLRYLQGINANLAFLGTNVWDAEMGVSTSTVAKQCTKQEILRRGGSAILLADSSKYGQSSPWTVAPLTAFSRIITDASLPEEAERAVAARGAQIVRAQ